MPIITIEGPQIDDMEARRALARTMTDAAVKAYGLPESAMVVIIHENPQECVATAGQLICDRTPRD